MFIDSEPEPGPPPARVHDPHPLVAYVVGPRMPLIPAPSERGWMLDTDRRFANRCLPLLIANSAGWLLLNPAAFTAIWSGNPRVDAMTVLYDDPSATRLAASFFGYGIITWSVPYLFRTPPGFDLLVRGPANAPKDGMAPLEGIVEADWASATFTMNWKVTRPGVPLRFEVDEPFAMIVPQRRGDLEALAPQTRHIEDDPELAARYQTWTSSRQEFLERLDKHAATGPGWQRDYFLGRHADGTATTSAHRTRRVLRPFDPPIEPCG